MNRLFLLLVAALAAAPARADLGANIYGVSYHFDRDRAKALGVDSGFNPGLGVRWRKVDTSVDWFADVGFYRDSGRNTAKLAGVGGLWHATENFRAGGAIALLHSDTYNGGRAFIAPLPVLAYELRPLTLNMVYLPKVHQVNDINTLGFWLTWWLR